MKRMPSWIDTRSGRLRPPVVVELGVSAPDCNGPRPSICKARFPEWYAPCGGSTENEVWGG